MDIYYKRIEIYKDTQKVAKEYFNKITKSIKYSKEQLDEIIDEIDNNITNNNNITNITNVKIVELDSIDALVSLLKSNNPVLLNMADPSIPGGCVNMGASAQEENIFRRTNLFMTLTMIYYPILNFDTIYSKDITLFRSSEQTNYTFIEPQKICIITCPSIRHPDLTQDGLFKYQNDIDTQYEKICSIFKTAIIHKHDSIVLSAFGCGAFKCPSKQVAELFKKAIYIYGHKFKTIIFAIKQPIDAQSKNNYSIFNEILNN